MEDKGYLDQALERIGFEGLGEYEEVIELWIIYGGD